MEYDVEEECPDCGGFGYEVVIDREGNHTERDCKYCYGDGVVIVREYTFAYEEEYDDTPEEPNDAENLGIF